MLLSQIDHWWSRLLRTLLDQAMCKERQKARLQQASASVASGQMHYVCSQPPAHEGQGAHTAVVMLHGAGADHTTWLRFAQELPRNLHLIIPDLPGHGASAYAQHHNYGIQSQVQRLVEWIDHLQLREIHLIGSSMGGAIAMRLAHQLPDRIKTLCLIDCAGAESKKSWLRQEVEKTGKNPMMEIRNTDDYRKMLRIGMNRPPYIPGIFLGILASARSGRNQQDAHIMRDISVDLDQRAILQQLAMPTLIIWGALDRITDVSDATLLAQTVPSNQLLILPDIGHVPMVESPAYVASQYTAFLQRHLD